MGRLTVVANYAEFVPIHKWGYTDIGTLFVLSREDATMTSHGLHPLAREVLEVFADQSYFRSVRLANALAELSPTHCVRWAFTLVERFINMSTPHDIVAQTISAVQHMVDSPSADQLPKLDELSWKSWCSGPFDDESPFAQRAVARLGWASMLLIGETTRTRIEFANNTGVHIAANANGTLAEMANQCAMAVDMIYSDTNDGRLMLASSFSREMEALS